MKMNALKKIVIAVLLLSLVLFVAFFGRLPALRYVSLVALTLLVSSKPQEDAHRSATSLPVRHPAYAPPQR